MTNLILAIAIQGAAAQAGPISLEWKPVKGSVIRDRTVMTGQVDISGTLAQMEVTTVSSRKCVEVAADGTATLEIKQEELTLKVDGTVVPQPADSRTLTVIYGKNGEPKSFPGSLQPEPADMEVASSKRFLFPGKPVAKGDGWAFKWDANNVLGTSAAETKFIFEGEETVEGKKLYKVSFAHQRLGGGVGLSSTAVVWLNPADGTEVKGEYTLKNVDFGHGFKAKEVKFRLSRIQ